MTDNDGYLNQAGDTCVDLGDCSAVLNYDQT